MMIWLTLFGMAAVTFLTRALPILALRGEPNPALARWLALVPAAVFTALAVPPLLVASGQLALDPARLLSGIVGAVAAWFSRSVPLTIAAGFGCYWLSRLIIG